MKRARKLSHISVWDYPRCCYTAYFQYAVNEIEDGDWTWGAQIIDYDAHVEGGIVPTLADQTGGGCATEEEARKAAQEWIKGQMEQYRREKPLPVRLHLDMSARIYDCGNDDDVNAIVEALNRCRKRKDFGNLDRLRGLLRAHDIKLKEPIKVTEGKVTWTR